MPVIQVTERRQGPRSLKSMALTVALRNASQITDLGDMAFADAAPILRHVDNPDQLHMLESNSPNFTDNPKNMTSVWTRLLTKKLPGWDTDDWEDKYGLTDDDRASMSWYEIFKIIKEARDRAVAADTAKLLQDMQGHRQAKENKSTHIVSSSRALNRITPGISTIKRRGPGGGPGMPSTLSFGGGSRTKTTTSQNVMKRVRREAKESLKVTQLSRVNAHSLTSSTSAAVAARNQIRHAPAAMLNDHRVAHKKDILATAAAASGSIGIRAPRRSRLADERAMLDSSGRGIPGTGLGVGNSAHEARLLALKRGSAGGKPANATASSTSSRPRYDSPEHERPSKSQSHSNTKKRHAEDEEPWDDLFDDGEDNGHSGKNGGYESYDERPSIKTTSYSSSSSKRPRLTIDDLESGYEDERPARKAPASSSRPSASTYSSSSSASRIPPVKQLPVREPPPPSYVPKASPSKGPPPGGRKKGVDIFMRPKKR
ncbi:rna polymerase ii transcription factor siii subunit a [Ophiostoma piceae UAMH 11346]|uniref:Rna polymerase ii transcription factor siii subunit a n=1 Tax=Ophiostoma piceae (strain UAMH 11346) TaxID=1262450 RepID=S3CK25_OPHP1|nr:rna polymerase ii transcription factor siii subunit a [Ophiostoma piceae UAMH 11346]